MSDGEITVLFEAESHRVLLRAEGVSKTEERRPDVSKLPGARVVAWLRLESETAQTLAGCVQGPSARFAPGIEDVLFERATLLALSSLPTTPLELAISLQRTTERSFEQVRSGKSEHHGLRTHHLITFVGEDRDILLCSLACEGQSCENAMLSVDGVPPLAPPPSLALRSFFGAAERPGLSLCVLSIVVLLVSALILWRRPRHDSCEAKLGSADDSRPAPKGRQQV